VTPELFLCVKNWKIYQHHQKVRTKSQGPLPWIKLYLALLEDYRFAQLSDPSKFHFIGILLLAGRYQNLIPYEVERIKWEIHASESVDFEQFIKLGLLEVCDHASTVLADVLQPATPEESRGEEIREEKMKPTASCTEAGLPAPVPEDAVLVSFETVGRGAKSWNFTRSYCDELLASFPDLDVAAEVRKSKAWVQALSGRPLAA
jgi:hypothetical protein